MGRSCVLIIFFSSLNRNGLTLPVAGERTEDGRPTAEAACYLIRRPVTRRCDRCWSAGDRCWGRAETPRRSLHGRRSGERERAVNVSLMKDITFFRHLNLKRKIDFFLLLGSFIKTCLYHIKRIFRIKFIPKLFSHS